MSSTVDKLYGFNKNSKAILIKICAFVNKIYSFLNFVNKNLLIFLKCNMQTMDDHINVFPPDLNVKRVENFYLNMNWKNSK